MKKRILIVTPRSPFQGRGADEEDRLSGIRWFINNGYEVRVITKTMPNDIPFILSSQKELGIVITSIPYKFNIQRNYAKKIWQYIKRLFWPPYWDGASFEYFDFEIQNAVEKDIADFNPELVWFDYSYLWPLYSLVPKNVPIFTRSINFEPAHFLDEDGRNPLNYIRVFPKLISEFLSFQKSDYFFSITPKEEKIYQLFGDTPTATLPLRSLPSRVAATTIRESHEGIHIGFMPSTYNVHHNLEALRFLVLEVVPSLPLHIRKDLTLHVTGNKFPKEMLGKMPKEVIYDGYVPSAILFWQSMDIAVSPSIFGAGMQQKIFEPITLGIPTITSKRGLAGYPFESNVTVICAETKDEVCASIENLINNREKLKSIGEAGKTKAKELFSQSIIDDLLKKSFETVNNLK